jgi:iron complex outermembrane receptor protein
VAAFHIDWEDQQVACQNPASFGGTSTQRTYVCNVGQAKIWGVETDGIVRVNDWITLVGNYAYTDATYEQFVDDSLAANLAVLGLPPLDFAGKRLPYVPEHKFLISPRVEFPIFGDFELEARVDASYQSRSFVRADNLQSFGEKTLVDLRVTLANDRYRLQGFVDNVFDDDTPVAAVRFFDSVNFSLPGPLVTGADRRLAGVSLGISF